MKLTSKPLAGLVVVILFGGIGFSTWMGWWQTETTRVPATYNEGELTGKYNPADIRGSYTFGDVSSLFEIPIGDLQRAFRLPDGSDPAGVALKDLESLYNDEVVEIGTASVRLFTAWYKGLPYEPTEDTFVFNEAAEILQAQGRLTADQQAYLEAHTAPEPSAAAELPAAATPQEVTTSQPTPTVPEHTPETGKVAGKTTLQDLLDWGVTKETLENVLGSPLPPPQTVIKDYCTRKGLTFSEIKTTLQAEVDKLP
jgi:hypothetical protein